MNLHVKWGKIFPHASLNLSLMKLFYFYPFHLVFSSIFQPPLVNANTCLRENNMEKRFSASFLSLLLSSFSPHFLYHSIIWRALLCCVRRTTLDGQLYIEAPPLCCPKFPCLQPKKNQINAFRYSYRVLSTIPKVHRWINNTLRCWISNVFATKSTPAFPPPATITFLRIFLLSAGKNRSILILSHKALYTL